MPQNRENLSGCLPEAIAKLFIRRSSPRQDTVSQSVGFAREDPLPLRFNADDPQMNIQALMTHEATTDVAPNEIVIPEYNPHETPDKVLAIIHLTRWCGLNARKVAGVTGISKSEVDRILASLKARGIEMGINPTDNRIGIYLENEEEQPDRRNKLEGVAIQSLERAFSAGLAAGLSKNEILSLHLILPDQKLPKVLEGERYPQEIQKAIRSFIDESSRQPAEAPRYLNDQTRPILKNIFAPRIDMVRSQTPWLVPALAVRLPKDMHWDKKVNILALGSGDGEELVALRVLHPYANLWATGKATRKGMHIVAATGTHFINGDFVSMERSGILQEIGSIPPQIVLVRHPDIFEKGVLSACVDWAQFIGKGCFCASTDLYAESLALFRVMQQKKKITPEIDIYSGAPRQLHEVEGSTMAIRPDHYFVGVNLG